MAERQSPKKLLLVDGYNVLRSGGRYSGIDGADHTHVAFNRARQTLVSDVAVFAKGSYHACVVFDGGGNPTSTGAVRDVAGVDVIFSPANTSADSVIEELAQKAQASGQEVVVVTSDATMQWTVLGAGVRRMSAAGFCTEMDGIQDEVEDRASSAATNSKNTLGGRLDEQTRAALERWARQR